MSFDYSRSNALASRLIESFGQSLTFSRKTSGTFDPATGTVSSTMQTNEWQTVWLSYQEDQIDGTLIRQGDARLLVDGSPDVGDTVTRDGEDWRVININPLQPAGVLVYTEAQVRK